MASSQATLSPVTPASSDGQSMKFQENLGSGKIVGRQTAAENIAISPMTNVGASPTSDMNSIANDHSDLAIDHSIFDNKNHEVFAVDQERVEEVPVTLSEIDRRNLLTNLEKKKNLPKLNIKDSNERSEQVGNEGKQDGTGLEAGGVEKVDEKNDNSNGSNTSLTDIQSDFLQTDITTRKSVRLTSALLNYTRPDGLNLVPLGSSNSLDALARLNNAIRRSLIDLYNMVDALRRYVHELRTPTVKKFFTWWMLFSSFLLTSFEAYGVVIVPWIASRTKTSVEEIINFTSINETINETVRLFDDIRAHMVRRAPDETIARVIRGLEKFVAVPQFLQQVEDKLPDTIDQCDPKTIQDRDFVKLHKSLLKHLHHNGTSPKRRRYHILLIERGMNISEVAAWKPSVPIYIRLASWKNQSRFEGKYVSTIREICNLTPTEPPP